MALNNIRQGRASWFPFRDHDDRDFTYALIASFTFYACLVLLIQTAQIPEPAREDFQHIPPRIAKLILQAPKPKPLIQTPPAPPKTDLIPKVKVEEQPKEKPTPPAPPKEKEAPLPKAEPEISPQQEARLRLEREVREAKALRKQNREIAMQSGILKLLTKEKKVGAGAGGLLEDKQLEKVFSQFTDLQRLKAPLAQERGRKEKVISGSGGIDDLIAALQEKGEALDTGDGLLGLGQRQVAQVESPIEIKGDSGQAATRSYESIREVVDALRGWIRFIYNRTLREDPTVKGTVTLEFTIAPSGEVTQCRVASSTVNHPGLESRLVNRFLKLRFDPVPEGENIVIYPITLIPSG